MHIFLLNTKDSKDAMTLQDIARQHVLGVEMQMRCKICDDLSSKCNSNFSMKEMHAINRSHCAVAGC